MKTYIRWAILWRQNNRLDGKQEYLLGTPDTGMTELFKTRKKARDTIELRYSFIRERPDLADELSGSHGWKMPKAVKVRVTVEEIKDSKKTGPNHNEFIQLVKTSMKRPEAKKAAEEAKRFLEGGAWKKPKP